MSFQRAGIYFGVTRDVFMGLWMDLGRAGLDLGGHCWVSGGSSTQVASVVTLCVVMGMLEPTVL